MKTITPFARQFLLIRSSFAMLLRFIRTVGEPMRLVCAALVFGAGLAGQAQPLGVNVINSTYTASASWWGFGGFLGNPDVSGSNSVVSASPAGIDYVNQSPSISTGPNYTAVWGEADAGLFQSHAFSDTAQGQYMNSFCYVSAINDISFSASLSQTAIIDMQFTGYDNWYQSDCLVSLNDVTSGQVLWNYGWRALGSSPYGFPYTDVEANFGSSGIFTVSVPTVFVGGDIYELVMNMAAESNNDNGGAQVRLSGLTALNVVVGSPTFVPEPPTFALIGSAAILLLLRRPALRWSLPR